MMRMMVWRWKKKTKCFVGSFRWDVSWRSIRAFTPDSVRRRGNTSTSCRYRRQSRTTLFFATKLFSTTDHSHRDENGSEDDPDDDEERTSRTTPRQRRFLRRLAYVIDAMLDRVVDVPMDYHAMSSGGGSGATKNEVCTLRSAGCWAYEGTGRCLYRGGGTSDDDVVPGFGTAWVRARNDVIATIHDHRDRDPSKGSKILPMTIVTVPSTTARGSTTMTMWMVGIVSSFGSNRIDSFAA